MNSKQQWRVDSHHHYWDPSRGDYPWMPDSGPLRKTFLPKHHRALNEHAQIGLTIAVQAAPTLEETQWLYEQAQDKDSLVVGVVGWIDLEKNDVEAQLDSISNPLLVAIRPMIQDITDDFWILKPNVMRNLKALASAGLTFDLLVRHHQLSNAFEALSKIPELTVVIDHLAKPNYTTVDSVWLKNMKNFASRENTFIKVSGLATEIVGKWEPKNFIPHVECAFALFGSDKVMFGTDWPVSLLAANHEETCALLDVFTDGLSESEYRKTWRNNALKAYNIQSEDED